MRYSLLAVFTGLTLICFALGLTQAPRSTQSPDAVRRYLSIRYDEYVESPSGRTIFGPSYNPEAPVVEIGIERLGELMPDTTFYRTELSGNSLCCLKIPILVSVRKTPEGADVRSSYLLAFDEPSKKFLQQFQIHDLSDSDSLLIAVAELFTLQHSDYAIEPTTDSVQILHHGQPWRTVELSPPQNSGHQTRSIRIRQSRAE